MVRAYAGDMAVVLPSICDLDILADAFDFFGKAAGLHANIEKTLCVPLHQTTEMQFKNDVRNTSWSQIGFENGYGKYFGFMWDPTHLLKLILKRLCRNSAFASSFGWS